MCKRVICCLCQDNDILSYKDLFKASVLFEGDFYAYDEAWLNTWKEVDWDRLHELPTEDVLADVIGFLNKWKCRLPYSFSLAEGIKGTHRNSISYIESLRGEAVEDWDFSIHARCPDIIYAS